MIDLVQLLTLCLLNRLEQMLDFRSDRLDQLYDLSDYRQTLHGLPIMLRPTMISFAWEDVLEQSLQSAGLLITAIQSPL